jgi:hypothetical protein
VTRPGRLALLWAVVAVAATVTAAVVEVPTPQQSLRSLSQDELLLWCLTLPRSLQVLTRPRCNLPLRQAVP